MEPPNVFVKNYKKKAQVFSSPQAINQRHSPVAVLQLLQLKNRPRKVNN
jgi:hypothetical protein